MAFTPTSPALRFREWASGAVLMGATGFAVVVALQSALVRSWHKSSWWPDVFGTKPWVDLSPALTLAVGLLSLLAVRAQFRIGLRPLLTHWTKIGLEAPSPLATRAAGPFYEYIIHNHGLGPALVRRVDYQVYDADPHRPFDAEVPERCPKGTISFDDCVDRISVLSGSALANDRDYRLMNFGAGASIGKDMSFVYASLPPVFWDHVGCLAVWMEYRGVLGSSYRKRLVMKRPPHTMLP